MEELILIKLGGSVITDKTKSFKANEKVIGRLGREIVSGQNKYKGKIIIGHGSGSFGHTLGYKYKTQEGIISEKSVRGAVLVEDAALKLNRIVVKNLLKVGLPVFSLSPASFVKAKNKKLMNVNADSIVKALNINMVPLVYGDIVFDSTLGFTIFSTEIVFEALITKLYKSYKILKIIHASGTNGVYGEGNNVIPLITTKTFKRFKKLIFGATSQDVTGGMLHKVVKSLQLAKKIRIETVILNGNISGELTKAILGMKVNGTLIRRD